jgi:hypothetical protein
VRPTRTLSVKLNDPGTKRTFYDTTALWHFTLGDGPVDF